MNEPSEVDMHRARMRILDSQDAYWEAIAAHHSRVAQVACDMRKIIELKRLSDEQTGANAALDMMARKIEQSFAEAFGVTLQAAVQKAESNG